MELYLGFIGLRCKDALLAAEGIQPIANFDRSAIRRKNTSSSIDKAMHANGHVVALIIAD